MNVLALNCQCSTKSNKNSCLHIQGNHRIECLNLVCEHCMKEILFCLNILIQDMIHLKKQIFVSISNANLSH